MPTLAQYVEKELNNRQLVFFSDKQNNLFYTKVYRQADSRSAKRVEAEKRSRCA